MVNEFRLLVRNKILHVFSLCFDADLIYLYNDYKHLPKIYERKKHMKQLKKYIYNFKNFVKGILWFCDKIHDKKTEDQTDILGWKISPPKASNNLVTKLIQISIDKNIIKEE